MQHAKLFLQFLVLVRIDRTRLVVETVAFKHIGRRGGFHDELVDHGQGQGTSQQSPGSRTKRFDILQCDKL